MQSINTADFTENMMNKMLTRHPYTKSKHIAKSSSIWWNKSSFYTKSMLDFKILVPESLNTKKIHSKCRI